MAIDMMAYGVPAYFEAQRLGQKTEREYGENIAEYLIGTLKDCDTDDDDEMAYYMQDRAIEWMNQEDDRRRQAQ